MKKLSIVSALLCLLATPAVALAETTECRGTLGPQRLDNIVVPDGATCTLNGPRAKGSIKVLTGATLNANAVTVKGNIQGEDAAAVNVNPNSFVGGNVQIKQGNNATVDDVVIGGDLQLDENRGSILARNNDIDGNLQAVKNTGGLVIATNRIRENLQCKENSPPPTAAVTSPATRKTSVKRSEPTIRDLL